MEEKLFTVDWQNIKNQDLDHAEQRVADLLSIVPRPLLKDIGRFLSSSNIYSGNVRGALDWRVNVDVAAYYSEGRYHLLDTIGGTDHVLRFDAKLRVLFVWQNRQITFSSFAISNELIANLTESTYFNGNVIFEALNSLASNINMLFFTLNEFIKDNISQKYGAECLFLFERASYHQSIGCIGFQNKNIELQKDKNVLGKIAAGLEKSKQFAKSKLLASLREKCEERIHELNFIIPGELTRSLKN